MRPHNWNMQSRAATLLTLFGTLALQNVEAFQGPVSSRRHLNPRYFALRLDTAEAQEGTADRNVMKTFKDESSLSQQLGYPNMPLELLDNKKVIPSQEFSFSYESFARENPLSNSVVIAAAKTTAADLLAQTVIAQTPLYAIDWERSLMFCVFGAVYSGYFQYLYQVNIFKRLFDVDKFTNQSWSEKLEDGPGLKALAAQTTIDLAVLTAVYLPTFYIFKASIFSGSIDPTVWLDSGISSFQENFAKDELDLIRVWLPADLVCFSVPLYWRLPARHIVSFVWTAYLSFARGGH